MEKGVCFGIVFVLEGVYVFFGFCLFLFYGFGIFSKVLVGYDVDYFFVFIVNVLLCFLKKIVKVFCVEVIVVIIE